MAILLKKRLLRINADNKGRWYPVTWHNTATLVRTDVVNYIENEGKGKSIDLENIKNFYSSYQDINKELSVYKSISVTLAAFVASYAYNINVNLSVSGINLGTDPTVVALAIAINAYFGLKTSLAFMHSSILKYTISAVIENQYDSQISQILRSSFLFRDNWEFYTPRSEHKIPTNFTTKIRKFASSISLVGLLFVTIVVQYTWILAIQKILMAGAEHYVMNAILCTVAALFAISSTLIVLGTLVPLPHKDWTTNSRFDLLEQFDPQKLDSFRGEVFGSVIEAERAVQKA